MIGTKNVSDFRVLDLECFIEFADLADLVRKYKILGVQTMKVVSC